MKKGLLNNQEIAIIKTLIAKFKKEPSGKLLEEIRQQMEPALRMWIASAIAYYNSKKCDLYVSAKNMPPLQLECLLEGLNTYDEKYNLIFHFSQRCRWYIGKTMFSNELLRKDFELVSTSNLVGIQNNDTEIDEFGLFLYMKACTDYDSPTSQLIAQFVKDNSFDGVRKITKSLGWETYRRQRLRDIIKNFLK